jgi:hypothetical protein
VSGCNAAYPRVSYIAVCLFLCFGSSKFIVIGTFKLFIGMVSAIMMLAGILGALSSLTGYELFITMCTAQIFLNVDLCRLHIFIRISKMCY